MCDYARHRTPARFFSSSPDDGVLEDRGQVRALTPMSTRRLSRVLELVAVAARPIANVDAGERGQWQDRRRRGVDAAPDVAILTDRFEATVEFALLAHLRPTKAPNDDDGPCSRIVGEGLQAAVGLLLCREGDDRLAPP